MKDGLHIDHNGTKYWHKEGNWHRDDGPAVICPDGREYWFKDGKPYEPSAHELMVWKIEEKEQTKNKTCQQAPHPQKPRKRTTTRTNTKRSQLSRTSKS